MPTNPGWANSGESVGGSAANTSRAAPPQRPSARASASASSSMTPPRDDVDDADARPGGIEEGLADHADGLGGLDHVEGDEVGGGGEGVEVDQLDVELAGPLGGDERVVGDDPHAEGAGPLGDQLADAAQADDAEGLVGQLDPDPLGALPAPVHQGGVGLGDVAGHRQQHGHGVLGGGEDVRLRGVDDHDAPRVAASTSTLSRPMPARPTTTRSVPASSTSAVTWVEERMMRAWAPGIASQQLLGVQPGLHVDVVAGGTQGVEPSVGDLLGDEHSGHRASLAPAPRHLQPPPVPLPPLEPGTRAVAGATRSVAGSDDRGQAGGSGAGVKPRIRP